MARRILFFVTIVAILVLPLWLSQRQVPTFVVSGFVEADETRVGSRVGGRVARVLVAEGTTVTTGQLLVELEPFDLQGRLAESEAKWQQARARLSLLQAGTRPEEIAQAKAVVDQRQSMVTQMQNGPRQQEIDTAVAELELARSELELAKKIFGRTEALVLGGATSREEFDRTTTELRVAESRVAVKQDALALLREGTRPEEIDQAKANLEGAMQAWKLAQAGSRAEEIAEATAMVQAADAARQVIQKQLEELRILCPADGTVEAIELQPGDLVSGNAPVLTLVNHSHLWVRAYVPENRLNLQLEDRVPVLVDSFPGERFQGIVTFVARQAEFTPRNVQTPEERSKQVFRIKVTLTDQQQRLRPGMSADVLLDEVQRDR